MIREYPPGSGQWARIESDGTAAGTTAEAVGRLEVLERRDFGRDDRARDRWLDVNYPGRAMTSTPGCYRVPGGHVSVLAGRVTVYGRRP